MKFEDFLELSTNETFNIINDLIVHNNKQRKSYEKGRDELKKECRTLFDDLQRERRAYLHIYKQLQHIGQHCSNCGVTLV